MSQETFDFEKRYMEWLDEFYIKNGYSINRITGTDNEKYDAILNKNGIEFLVEEKGAQYLHKDMVIELVQDFWSRNWGWYLKTQANYIIYIYYVSKDAILPCIVYRVLLSKLRTLMKAELPQNKLKIGVTSKNYGTTINAYIPWEYLKSVNIVDEIYTQQESLFDIAQAGFDHA